MKALIVSLLLIIGLQASFSLSKVYGEQLFINSLMAYTKNSDIDKNSLMKQVRPLQKHNSIVFKHPTAQIFSYYPGLINKLQYISLGNLPTPVHKLENMSSFLDIPNLYIKRDDLTGKILPNGDILFGGNKIRKLEFLFADALYNGAETVITFGGVGSNHAVATAAYAELLGLRCICLLKGQPNAYTVQRNLLLMHHYQATMLWFANIKERNNAAVNIFANNKQQYGDFPYVIPPGGSIPIGTVGYVNGVFELKEQIKQGLMPEPDYIYVAVGSMGTMVGLLLGLKAAGLGSKVVAVNTDLYDNPQDAVDGVMKLFNETNSLLHEMDSAFPLFSLVPEEIIILNDFCGIEYGRFTQEGIRCIKLMQEKENILLDGTYTSKAFAGLVHDVKARNIQDKVILFWNTWCSDSFACTINQRDYKKLPTDFHRYFETPIQEG